VDESRRSREEDDPDAIDPKAIDWQNSRPLEVDLDPALLEHIRARRRLRQLTLRVGVEQIEEARRVAARTGLKYQAVLRRWLSEGASLARTRRLARASEGRARSGSRP